MYSDISFMQKVYDAKKGGIMYKIVFCDIDGTLLNSKIVVTPKTRECVLALNEKGKRFVIASGRSPSGIYPIMQKNGFCFPMVTCSGALILDENRKTVYENGIDISTVRRLIDYIESERMKTTWCIYTGDDWYVKDKSDPKVIREEEIIESYAFEGTVDSIGAATVHKLLCICDPGGSAEVEEKISAAFPEVNAVRSSDILVEIMNRGVNKAESVKLYCDHLGISPEEAIAIGDNYNDIEMLEAVGLGVVMGNAPEEIKRRFSFITDDFDHDGVAVALERLI